MAIDDGGPAFPVHVAEILNRAAHSGEFGMPGMSLRDYFAGQALASPQDMQIVMKMAAAQHCTPTQILARICYDWADAMIAARKVEPVKGSA